MKSGLTLVNRDDRVDWNSCSSLSINNLRSWNEAGRMTKRICDRLRLLTKQRHMGVRMAESGSTLDRPGGAASLRPSWLLIPLRQLRFNGVKSDGRLGGLLVLASLGLRGVVSR